MTLTASNNLESLTSEIKTVLDKNKVDQAKSSILLSVLFGFSQLILFAKISKDNGQTEHLSRTHRNLLSSLDFLSKQIAHVSDHVTEQDFKHLMALSSELNLTVSRIANELLNDEKQRQ